MKLKNNLYSLLPAVLPSSRLANGEFLSFLPMIGILALASIAGFSWAKKHISPNQIWLSGLSILIGAIATVVLHKSGITNPKIVMPIVNAFAGFGLGSMAGVAYAQITKQITKH